MTPLPPPQSRSVSCNKLRDPGIYIQVLKRTGQITGGRVGLRGKHRLGDTVLILTEVRNCPQASRPCRLLQHTSKEGTSLTHVRPQASKSED